MFYACTWMRARVYLRIYVDVRVLILTDILYTLCMIIARVFCVPMSLCACVHVCMYVCKQAIGVWSTIHDGTECANVAMFARVLVGVFICNYVSLAFKLLCHYWISSTKGTRTAVVRRRCLAVNPLVMGKTLFSHFFGEEYLYRVSFYFWPTLILNSLNVNGYFFLPWSFY